MGMHGQDLALQQSMYLVKNPQRLLPPFHPGTLLQKIAGGACLRSPPPSPKADFTMIHISRSVFGEQFSLKDCGAEVGNPKPTYRKPFYRKDDT